MDNSPKIGISGGTFDPIHIGHLIIAEEVCDFYGLEKVLFIPVGSPPHKELNHVTPAWKRLEMVKRAILENERFEVLDIEVKREGYTYAYDSLSELKKLHGNTKLFYIIGADVVLDLLTWKNFEEVFEMCEFVAVLRPGFQRELIIETIEDLRIKYNAKISLFEVPLIGVSSTLIRERVKEDKTVRYLLPKGIQEYIKANKLYQ